MIFPFFSVAQFSLSENLPAVFSLVMYFRKLSLFSFHLWLILLISHVTDLPHPISQKSCHLSHHRSPPWAELLLEFCVSSFQLPFVQTNFQELTCPFYFPWGRLPQKVVFIADLSENQFFQNTLLSLWINFSSKLAYRKHTNPGW